MKKLRLSLALAGVLAVLVAGQMSASAHTTFIYHGDGEMPDSAGTSSDHYSGVVCDNEVDGHYVYGQWRTAYGTYTERDGGDGPCDYIDFAAPAYEFRLCEENKGCTRWYGT